MPVWIWATRNIWISCSNHSYSHMRSYASNRMKATNIFIIVLVSVRYREVIMSAIASQNASVSIFFNRLFRRRSKKTSKVCVAGLFEGNSPVTGGILSQRARNAKKCFHLMTSSCSNHIILARLYRLSVLFKRSPNWWQIHIHSCFCEYHISSHHVVNVRHIQAIVNLLNTNISPGECPTAMCPRGCFKDA